MPQKRIKTEKAKSGKLRIGDNWNAITIIALSQNNPLKAIAEFVENSIDARATAITIIRGKTKGETYLKIIDDGQGVPLNEEGIPNFQYVATHICDSIKRRMKEEGLTGIQGEFGIGLLSFWTVGEHLTMSCCGQDNKVYHMGMERADPDFQITHRQLLSPFKGTELWIASLLPGLRQINGEKIQRYLASELRDRIRQTAVKIKMIDHLSRAEYQVEPRQFSGQLVHQLPPLTTPHGEIYAELYLNSPDHENKIGLYRLGTRVLASLTQLDDFNSPPWTSGFFQGIIETPFLQLTPGTRDGIIRDERFDEFCQAMEILKEQLKAMIQEQERAREEKSSKQILKTVQLALKEAILALPQEEYDWFEVHTQKMAGALMAASSSRNIRGSTILEEQDVMIAPEESLENIPKQKSFFEFPGPLFSVKIVPSSSIAPVNSQKNLRAVCRDRKRIVVDQNLSYQWTLLEGAGTLTNTDNAIVAFAASADPCLNRIGIKVHQDDVVCEAEALITVTDSILTGEDSVSETAKKGLPGYTLKSAPGELWRSRYDMEQNLVVINNAHRDFVYASKEKNRKLRYICRLFIKELILANFLNIDPVQLLERMVELSLYTEESLR